jgi:hypothetical protein
VLVPLLTLCAIFATFVACLACVKTFCFITKGTFSLVGYPEALTQSLYVSFWEIGLTLIILIVVGTAASVYHRLKKNVDVQEGAKHETNTNPTVEMEDF